MYILSDWGKEKRQENTLFQYEMKEFLSKSSAELPSADMSPFGYLVKTPILLPTLPNINTLA